MLTYLVRKYWQAKVKERKKIEIKLIKKVLRRKMTAADVAAIVNSPLSLELLGADPKVTIRGVDNRKI